MNAALVFIGGGLGAVLRWLVTRATLALFGPGIAWGTMIVNVVGCLAMGLAVGLFANQAAGTGPRLFLATGLLGGFTTFSAFSLDAITLYQRGATVTAACYVIASLALSLAALVLGLLLSRAA